MASLPVPMLSGDNCTMWAIKVKPNLDAQGLWEAVVPAEDAATAFIVKKDKLTRAYLLGTLSEDILLQVLSKKTMVELWASLKTRFVGQIV
ncbi:retrotransposon protein, putative, Ty1-copia subclass [Hordeum vulgare]|nr:retrotransposon protein, putative, Ty1-copia subclass [Hordeum vulgare]